MLLRFCLGALQMLILTNFALQTQRDGWPMGVLGFMGFNRRNGLIGFPIEIPFTPKIPIHPQRNSDPPPEKSLFTHSFSSNPCERGTSPL